MRPGGFSRDGNSIPRYCVSIPGARFVLTSSLNKPIVCRLISFKDSAVSTALMELQAQAKQLGPDERAQLAYFLLESLDSVDRGDVGGAWETEIAARWSEIERGDVEMIPATEVFAEVRRKLL